MDKMRLINGKEISLENLKVAYALNMCTVSISQIVDYNDIYILEQEYEAVLNNINLEVMPKDEALLATIKEILNTITFFRIHEIRKKQLEKEYQQRMKNVIWSSVPNIGMIVSGSPAVMAMALATQVGIGYMNYRKEKTNALLEQESSEIELQITAIEQLNALRQELFEAAWRLADKYEFPDVLRLTERQISKYNAALMENNLFKRYNKLDDMKAEFEAYPVFWYQMGSTANSIFRGISDDANLEIKYKYRSAAIYCFEKYEKLNKFNLLRQDLLTASWALEYLELLELNQDNNPEKAKELIEIAKKYSGDALDVLELCAFAYLKIGDYIGAIKTFHTLVNNDYNVSVNTQILSGLYIQQMHEGDSNQKVMAEIGYAELPNITETKYILALPPKGMNLAEWHPVWNFEESMDELLEKQKVEDEKNNAKQIEARYRAREFYQKPICLVYPQKYAPEAELFKGILDENRVKLDDRNLPFAQSLELKEYRKMKSEYERNGYHIIMLGNSEEAKNIYKNANNGKWDYSKYGINYVSKGTKTVLLLQSLKNKDIDGLIEMARKLNEKFTIKIPDGVKSVKFTWLKEYVSECFTVNSFSDIFASAIVGLIVSPAIVGIQVIENGMNICQKGINIKKSDALELLQCTVAIYKYLESENALVD